MKKPPYKWSWEELEKHLAIFDRIEVTYFDGGEHVMFSGDSGVSVLRITDVSPVKSADDQVILHISTDSQWFSKERMRILPDSYIKETIEKVGLSADDEERVLKALKIGTPPPGEPHIAAERHSRTGEASKEKS